jgi:hypothetical protein
MVLPPVCLKISETKKAQPLLTTPSVFGDIHHRLNFMILNFTPSPPFYLDSVWLN